MFTLMFWNANNEALLIIGRKSQIEFDTYKEAWNYAEVTANKMFKKGAVEATISGNGTTDTYDIY